MYGVWKWLHTCYVIYFVCEVYIIVYFEVVIMKRIKKFILYWASSLSFKEYVLKTI